MFQYSPVWPHGDLQPAFTDVFYVLGTNRTHHAGVDYQTSRTMVVVRERGVLTSSTPCASTTPASRPSTLSARSATS